MVLERVVNVIKPVAEAPSDSIDIALLVSTNSRQEIDGWDRSKIVDSLIKEAGAAPELAEEIAEAVEDRIDSTNMVTVTTAIIREMVDLELLDRGLTVMHKRHTHLGLPMWDVEQIISNANKENSNTTHNPESVNLTLAETILKEFALRRVFSEDVAQAHYMGDLHLHDLGFIIRPYTYAGDTLVEADDGRVISLQDLYDQYPLETNPEDGTWVKYPKDGLRIRDKDGYVGVRRLVKRERREKRMLMVKTEDGRGCVVTHDHPMLVLDGEDYGMRPAEAVRVGDLLSTFDLEELPQAEDIDLLALLGAVGRLAGYKVTLQDGSELPAPVVREHIRVGRLDRSDLLGATIECVKSSNDRLPVLLPLTSDLGWLVGFIIGDGHSDGSCIGITQQDGETFERLLKIIDDLGISTGEKDHGTSIRLTLNSKIWTDVFFAGMSIGTSARKKGLPPFFASTNGFRQGLLAGLVDSDGTVDGTGVSIRVASAKLTWQAYELAKTLGLRPTCQKPAGVGSTRVHNGRTISQRYPVWPVRFSRLADVHLPSMKYESLTPVKTVRTAASSTRSRVVQVVDVDIPDTFIYDVTTDSGTLLANGIYSKNCGGHSLEFIKKFGLNLPNITSVSKPAQHAEVLIGHMVKMASALQAHYAGAVGWEAVNLFFAPYLEGKSREEMKQLAQMLIFEFNQLAGARGSLRGDETIFVYDARLKELRITPIGEFVDSFIENEGEATARLEEDRYYALSFDRATGQTILSRIYAGIRHANTHEIVELRTSLGQTVKVTDNHSLFRFTETGEVGFAEPRQSPSNVLVPGVVDVATQREPIDTLCLLGTTPSEDGLTRLGRSRLGVPTQLEITPELARLLGYYVSEGSLGCQVRIHIFDDELAADVARCVRAVFDVPTHQRGGTVHFGGQTHVALFEALCGRRAENKRVPTGIMLGSSDDIRGFLAGYLVGDGYVTGTRIGCSTVSRVLASQVWLMLTMLGARPSRRSGRPNAREIAGVSVRSARTRYTVTVGRTHFDKLRFPPGRKEAARLSGLEGRPAAELKEYSYAHLKPLIKSVFGDRISLKSLSRLTPERISTLLDDVRSRLASVDVGALCSVLDEDMLELCATAVKRHAEMPYGTRHGLLRQLEMGDLPVHSPYVRPSSVLGEEPPIDLRAALESLSVPMSVRKGTGLNHSHLDFDARQLDSNMNMYMLGARMAVEQYAAMEELEGALDRAANLLPVAVKSIDPIENAEYVYDIGVAGTENFLTGEGVFAHNSQVVFTDFNLYYNVPAHFAETPAIGPGGRYTGKTYGQYQREAQEFLSAMFEVYLEGDATGKTFVFPKPLLHINDDFFKTEGHEEFFELACRVASKQGITYFVFDRGDEVTVSQCCRLKLKLSAADLGETKTPERMRFSALQNVTVNLPRIAYKAGGNDAALFMELNKALELVAQAHVQKRRFIEDLVALGKEGPLGLLTQNMDGDAYLKMDRLTYLAGVIGLNELVQAHTGEQLHESEEALRFGLKVVSAMNLKCRELSERHGIKMVLEESPAESAGYRLAKLDMKYWPEQTCAVVKGDVDSADFYYTNSIHMPVAAPIDYLERVEKQSRFHPLIEAGAIVHVWLGEHEPEAAAIRSFVEKTFRNTQCAQVAFSPEFTVCEKCRRTSRGLKPQCPLCGSTDVYGITRIVGYFSKVQTWNHSKIGELYDRVRTGLQGSA